MKSFCEQLDLTYPIVQAPMAGGATTLELVTSVSNFGGLGSLGAGMTAPDKLEEMIIGIKNKTNKAFAVNLMVLTKEQSSRFDKEIPAWLASYYKDKRIDFKLPKQPAQDFDEQLSVLLKNPVPVVSFTFGIISPNQIESLHKVGSKVVGTANHPLEARYWEEAGADAVCLQGLEAGGHRGGWLADSEDNPLGLLTLIEQTRCIVDIPLIAAGGIMHGRTINAVRVAGAELAQLGTAFLTIKESGINQTYKKALLEVARGERNSNTRLTRLFSGKLARGLTNTYLEKYIDYDSPNSSCADLPPYPQLNAMTKPMRARAAQSEDPEFLSLWASQGVCKVKNESVDELMQRLVTEMKYSCT